MALTIGSARSYTSTSGSTSAPILSSSMGGSLPFSSSVSHELVTNKQLGGQMRTLIAGKPAYGWIHRLPGDVFFHIEDTTVGHTNMLSSNPMKKVDSVDPDGVRIFPLDRDRKTAIVFRFHDAKIAFRAAKIAEEWANTYRLGGYDTDGVGYSDHAKGFGVTGRVIGALIGSGKFGTGARARLLKYRNRTGMKPKNVICSEMVILAYQLAMAETDDGFIKLDAKHSIPSTLFRYFLNHPGHWSVVSHRHVPNL